MGSYNNNIYMNIQQVAKQLYIVPATLRNWEKAGLIKPKRLDNNYRVYTMDDLDLLRKIRNLSIDENMSASAIKSILYGDIIKGPKNEKQSSQYSKKLINSRWKSSREQLGLSLEVVSEKTGIDIRYLEGLENGTADIEIKLLSDLALFYGESILYFFDVESEDSMIVRKGKGEIAEVGLEGVKMESLIKQKKHVLFPMHFTIEPGFGSVVTHKHRGEEYIYVLSGELKVTLNYENTYTIKKGDSMFFKSSEPHSWHNHTENVTKVLWVHSPVQS